MLIKIHDESEGIRVLTFDRPPANAITVEFLADLKTAVDGAAADDGVRAVLVRGNEKFFSAGLDLKALAEGGAAPLARIGQEDGMAALWTLPKPTVAEVAGHAIAGGAILAMACDFRVTCEGPHRFGINENAFGIAFPREAFEIVRLALPGQFLGRILLEGALYSPGSACEMGFVHEVVSDTGALSSRCLEMAAQLGSYPRTGYAHNKRLLQEPGLERCGRESEASRQALVDLWSHPDTLEGILQRVATLGKGG